MTDWRERARCHNHDPELFFPQSSQPHDDALAICRRCPVIDDCGRWADEHRAEGIWGGTFRDYSNHPRAGRNAPRTVENYHDTWDQHGGDIQKAAERLHIQRASLVTLLRRAMRRGEHVRRTT